LREARAASVIESDHIARVFDLGELPSAELYMVMELLVGEDLNDVIKKRGPLPLSEAVDYVIQACRGVGAAHRRDIVHRDLKPANLFLTKRRDGTPLIKVLDFGISKSLGVSDENLTTTGDVLGSPAYMSPEQIRDPRRVDHRTDLWALGCILYKLVTGRAPFLGAGSAATLAKIMADPAPSVRGERPDAPPCRTQQSKRPSRTSSTSRPFASSGEACTR
jgi:serine/threonine-protein kinase